jgi:prevent-host-death family protein
VTVVNVQDAKTRLSDLLARAERGEEVIIARAGTPIVRLVLVEATPPRRFGGMTLTIPDDFDAAMTEAELSAWE